MHRANAHVRAGLVSVVLTVSAICILASPTLGQVRRRDKAGKAPPASVEDRIDAQQAKAWSAFYAGKHKQAAKLAGALLKAPKADVRVQAAHCQARCYWATGRKSRSTSGRAKAKRIWTKLEKASTLNVNLQRLVIAKALMAEAGKNDTQAIKLLESVLKRGIAETCTAEAAIELGRLQAKARRFDDAKRAYDFAKRFLKRTVRREVSAAVIEPFVKAAEKAREHLKYLEDAGREEFEQAEALRRKDKFIAAARLYRQIIRKCPDSGYAPRSELHLGHCLLGMRRARQAAVHWKKFIKPAPAGPWRGQAYVALIDLYLEHLLDLGEAGKYAELARNSLSAALKDEKAGGSWKAVAFDVHLRVGIVAFAQGQGQLAAASFEQALKTDRIDEETREGLRRLIAAAKTGQSLLPKGVRGSTALTAGGDAAKPSKAATALSMAMIYQLAGRDDNAQAMLARVLPRKLRPKDHADARSIGGATVQQTAFATYCQARVYMDDKEYVQARELAQTSLKAARKADWHDATLYLLATLVDREAQAKFGRASEITDPKTKKPKPAHSLSKAERKKLREAEKQRLSAFIKARAAAFPYYSELIRRFPESPYVEPAAYYGGCLLYETGQFTEAMGLLSRFVDTYKRSYFAGDAYVKLIDIHLERRFELRDARAYAFPAAEWAKDHVKAAAAKRGRDETRISLTTTLPPWAPTVESLSSAAYSLRLAVYQIYLRAGLIAYLDQQHDRAAAMFKAAKPFTPPRGLNVVSGKIPTGIERIIAAAKAKKKLTPDEVLKGDDKVKLILQLADIYHEAEQFEQALGLSNRLLNSNRIIMAPIQRSWALYKRGRSWYCLQRDPKVAQNDYLAAAKAAPKAAWAFNAVYLSANVAHNYLEDVDAAVKLWQRVISEYPECEEAERAAYYVGIAYEWSGRLKEAQKAYKQALTKFPGGEFTALVQKHLRQVQQTIKDQK